MGMTFTKCLQTQTRCHFFKPFCCDTFCCQIRHRRAGSKQGTSIPYSSQTILLLFCMYPVLGDKSKRLDTLWHQLVTYKSHVALSTSLLHLPVIHLWPLVLSPIAITLKLPQKCLKICCNLQRYGRSKYARLHFLQLKPHVKQNRVIVYKM